MSFKKIDFKSKATEKLKYSPDTLGYGRDDAHVWKREQIKTIHRLSGRPRETYHRDWKILYSIASRTPLFLMEDAMKELDTRIRKEGEIPREWGKRGDITTLYLRILWRKCYNYNELNDGDITWTELAHKRKSRPIRHYNKTCCRNSKQRALLEGCMVDSKGIWEMHHGIGKSLK